LTPASPEAQRAIWNIDMQSTEVPPIKVTIVGGGIGGLTAVLALLQRGIDVDVALRSPFDLMADRQSYPSWLGN
jgi:NADPH-dependent 2,4-dienoyl-CoA reductase/sulfur reductase-like enzyme